MQCGIDRHFTLLTADEDDYEDADIEREDDEDADDKEEGDDKRVHRLAATATVSVQPTSTDQSENKATDLHELYTF